jgi:pSer/pThr/pTyr-binding forkhead associated (FHA) protein
MSAMDFPTWFDAGSYGGLVFSLLAAAAIAFFALRLRRGTPRQLARATLACLFCCCLMFVPIWWAQSWFDLLGPTLDPPLIGFWLAWTAVVGWSLPLGIAVGYALLSAPQPLTAAVPVPAHLLGQPRGPAAISRPTALDDPARLIEPLGPGRPWGQLVPLDGPFAARVLPLTLQMALLGREADCDIVVPDDQASRHHAELRWDHSRVHLVDRGSLNGTRVNGQGVIGQVPLRDGDVIEIGSQRYRFESLTTGPRPPTPSGPIVTDAEETRKVARPARAISGPHATPATLALVAGNGPTPGARWNLDGALVTVGRDPSCEVCLPDSSVSRRHAQIVRQPSGPYVQDLDSQNGTLLNGQPLLAPAPLRAGDVLQVGEVVLRCAPASATPTTSDPRLAAPAAPGPPAIEATDPARVARALPNTHMLLSPQPRAADRPHLAPPRLLPPQPPWPDGQS